MFLVSDRCFPQTIDVLRGACGAARHPPRDRLRRTRSLTSSSRAFGLLLQYPDDHGAAVRSDVRSIARAHAAGVLVAVATDLLALTLLTPPGEMGADAVVGNSQRFGVPLGYGGPHAAFFATREAFVRQAAGTHHRRFGRRARPASAIAWRSRRASSTSGARRRRRTSARRRRCSRTSPAMCAVYHGPDGLRAIAERVHGLTRAVDAALQALGFRQTNRAYFDTLWIEGADVTNGAAEAAEARGINFRYDGNAIGISLDETVTVDDAREDRRSGFGSDASGGRSSVSQSRRSSGSASRRTSAFPDAPGVQHASFRDTDDALHPAASSGRTSGSTRR